MNFTTIEFLIEVYKVGFNQACESFAVGRNNARNMIKELESYFGFDLLVNEHLTENAISILPYAKAALSEIAEGMLKVCEKAANNNVLIIRSSFSYGKSVILPAIADIGEKEEFSEAKVDLITGSNSYRRDIMNTHVIFHEISKNENMFFDTKWSVKIEQGLYASEGYLSDIGHVPQNPEDLKLHSVLAHGEFFDSEIYKDSNWHLSGKYGFGDVEPSMMISSQTVLVSAIEANLGIGPIVLHNDKIAQSKLVRILPHIDGPVIMMSFSVRRSIPDELNAFAKELEKTILNKLLELKLEIVYH